MTYVLTRMLDGSKRWLSMIDNSGRAFWHDSYAQAQHFFPADRAEFEITWCMPEDAVWEEATP